MAGWLVPGRRHKDKVESLKYMQHQAVPTLNQLLVAQMLERGGYDRYLRQFRQEYARNVARMVSAISLSFPQGTRSTQPEGGIALWVELPKGVDAMELHRRASLENIVIAPASRSRPPEEVRQLHPAELRRALVGAVGTGADEVGGDGAANHDLKAVTQ